MSAQVEISLYQIPVCTSIVANVVNLFDRRPSLVHHTECPALFTTRWAWRSAAHCASGSATAENMQTSNGRWRLSSSVVVIVCRRLQHSTAGL